MNEIYIYESNCEDFTNFGLVGALTPTSCVFEEAANGMSEITLEHPLDALGRFAALKLDRILSVSVPVRTTPEIRGNKIVTSVEKWTVKSADTITKAMRTLYKKKTGSRKIKILPGGAEVTVVEKPEEGRYKVKSSYGTGYMEPDGLTFVVAETIADNSQSIESVQPSWTVKPQFFRISNVDSGIDKVTVTARHISYDLLYNLTSYKNDGLVKCSDALAAIMDGCVDKEHDFAAFTNMADERAGFNWDRVNPISALLDPESGLTARYGAALVRDNWELYILKDPGLNRGVTVEYAKNMQGLSCKENTENTVTRIIPIGETKDGKELLLNGVAWVDSPKIGNYPFPKIQTLKCENCKVGTDGVTTAIAHARMKEQAEAVFAGGGDMPTLEMDVDFIDLGDTAEFRQYKDLMRLFLWDYVIIRHKKLGLDVTARIVSIKWDCLLGRMQEMQIGQVGKTLANAGVNTWQIPAGISGAKIGAETIGNRALQSDIISVRHMQAESIATEALQAMCVTAAKIAAGAITADKLDADTVYARVLEVVTAKIKSLTADDIETDELAAELARVTVLIAGSAEFDRATIQHLVAKAMNLEFGVAGQVFIRNLAVEYAQMVGATIGNLCIKASDGNYYLLDVGADGNVQATPTTVSEGEINAGETDGGRVILETNITASNLNTSNLLATYALINKIDAARIDVAELIARKAFIDMLYTSHIFGGKSLEMIAGEATDAKDTADDLAKMQTWVGENPPPAPIPKGRQWIDQGVAPSVLRTWIGEDVPTDRDNADAASGELVNIVGKGDVQSFDNITLTLQPAQSGSGKPYPPGGGKNIFSRPLTAFTTYSGATATIQQNVSVPEWGAKDAVRYHGTGGTNTVVLLCGTGGKTIAGQAYAHSIYVKNNGANPVSVSNNWLTGGIASQSVPAGTATRVELSGTGNGTNNIQFSILTSAVGQSYDIIIWHAQIELSSTATAYEPYANIRPMIWRTSASITRCGKNLCPAFLTQTVSGVTFTAGADGSVTVTGTATDTAYLTGLITLPAGTYTVSGAPTGSSLGKYDMLVQIREGNVTIARSFDGSTAASFTLVQNTALYVHLRVLSGDAGDGKVFHPQIEVGNAATAYVPYRGVAYTANFGKAILGGHLYWQPSNNLSSEWTYVDFDGTENWNQSPSGYVYLKFGNSIIVDGGVEAFCSHYVRYTQFGVREPVDGEFFVGMKSFSQVESHYVFKDSKNGANVAAWKAYLAAQKAAGTPVQIAYKANTAVTGTLSAPLISPISGQNVLYSNSGSMNVNYTWSGWRVVNDTDEIQRTMDQAVLDIMSVENQANNTADELERRIRINSEGLHVGDSKTNDELLLQSGAIHFVVNGTRVSTISKDYYRIGNMEIRTPPTNKGGGMIIQAYKR